jgi:hypothetical protein
MGSCDYERFSVVFLDPRANAELVPRLHVALHASHAALPMVTSKFRPNIALPTLAPILLMQPLQRHINIYIYIPVKKTELTTGGIRCADHATPSIRKSWH